MARSYGLWTSTGPPAHQGGQGAIFEVTHANGEPPGIWLLKRLKNPKRQIRFDRELRALSAMAEVPNVVQIIDKGAYRSDAVDYYVMERGDGSLSALAPENGYEPERAFKFFADVVAGVEALHCAGIIHRDLKPDNIILFGETAKVGDPGLSLLIAEERITPSDEAVGPRFYMAPELEHGRNLDVDIRADIYSLGKLLYWLLSGGVNLPRERYHERSYALHLTRAPALAVFAIVFKRTLTPAPTARYASIAELRNGFEQAVGEYRAHPDTSLMRKLDPVPHSFCSLNAVLPQLDYEECRALVKRAEVGLLKPSFGDLMTLIEIEPRLRDDKAMKLLWAHAPISPESLLRVMRYYFEADDSARVISIGSSISSEIRNALFQCVLTNGTATEIDRLARIGGTFFLHEPELLQRLLERIPAPLKIPRSLVSQMATSASFAGKASLMHRAAIEAGTDPEALLPAMVGLSRSDDPGVEDLIREVFDRLKSSEEVLLEAAAALIASEPGISVLRSLVGDVHLSGETRSRLQIALEIADELAVDDDR